MKTIYDVTKPELRETFKAWGEPAFRADQLWTWLYTHHAPDFESITTLPKELRAKLAETYTLDVLKPLVERESGGGQTTKWLFALPDGTQIETVLMAYADRRTVCISSQAGCAVGCVFCATGRMGLVRNLSAGEIVAQGIFAARRAESEGGRLSNIVLMGMGEPFHNYDAVLAAVHRFNDDMEIGQRRITLSTVGWVPGINKLADEGLQIELAVSLHTADDFTRQKLIPAAERWSVREVIKACRNYFRATGRRITFEWAMIDGVNDSMAQAEAFADLVHGFPAHVNLIPLNPVQGYAGEPSPKDKLYAFRSVLEERGISVTMRLPRGIDIQAGCGQLKAARR